MSDDQVAVELEGEVTAEEFETLIAQRASPITAGALDGGSVGLGDLRVSDALTAREVA